uniref:Uncharacterized protein n=1 Tax=Acrobeloides nanus TaxID=290746 RepID=A0A914CPR8_9BILA
MQLKNGGIPFHLLDSSSIRDTLSIMNTVETIRPFNYSDYRNGSTYVATAAGCSASNTALVNVYNVLLMIAKSSTVLFGFAVYIAMFLFSLILRKKKAVNN